MIWPAAFSHPHYGSNGCYDFKWCIYPYFSATGCVSAADIQLIDAYLNNTVVIKTNWQHAPVFHHRGFTRSGAAGNATVGNLRENTERTQGLTLTAVTQGRGLRSPLWRRVGTSRKYLCRYPEKRQISACFWRHACCRSTPLRIAHGASTEKVHSRTGPTQ